MIEALNDFVQKTGDDEALCNRHWNTASAKIKKFVFVDLAGSRPVAATDVVGEDFQAGHRIGFGIVAQQEIAHFLIGISEVGMRLYPDQPTENGAGTIVERVLVKEIA